MHQDQTKSCETVVPGSILVVVHDFEARSPDELSLSKNDRIELLERDDEFGDGWYLGRHLGNDQTGLFPEGTKTHANSLPTHTNLAAVTQDVGYLRARGCDSSHRCAEMAQQPTVRRLLSSQAKTSSPLRPNALIRDDISSRHQLEIDRRGIGGTLVFPLPPSRVTSQAEQATLFSEQEDIIIRQSEINSQSSGDRQFLSPTVPSPLSKRKGCLHRKWGISCCHQAEIDPQGTRNMQGISTTITSPLKQGVVLSCQRDEISSRVQAELVRRITAATGTFPQSGSASPERRTAIRPRVPNKSSSCIQAEIGCRIAAGAEPPLQSSTHSSRKQITAHSNALEEISTRVQAELDRRVAASTGVIPQPSTLSSGRSTVRSKSLEDVFKDRKDEIEKFDTLALSPLPLFSTPPRARHSAALPSGVEETPSRQQRPIRQGVATNMAPCVVAMYTTTIPPAASTTSALESAGSIHPQIISVPAAVPPVLDGPRAASPTLPFDSIPRVFEADQSANKFETAASTPPTFSSSSTTASIPSTALRNITIATGSHHIHGEESPVMSETLSVIDEHITDMSTPRHSIAAANRRGANDSGSEYSNHAERRLSYITGELTDEEEQCTYTEAQVLQWSPIDVASYLHGVGVESYHCQIFQEQEISGEVLLGMSQSDLFIEAFDLGLLGRRLRTWHKIRALQDEVKGSRSTSRTADSYYGMDGVGMEDAGRTRGGTVGAVLPRIPSLMERPGSQQHHDRLSIRQANQQQLAGGYSVSPSALTLSSQDSPTRPPAASSREPDHKRRHSSIDVRTAPSVNDKDIGNTGATTPHRKERSFDRSWTMDDSYPTANGRPSTSKNGQEFVGGHKTSTSFDRNRSDNRPRDSGYTTLNPKDLDRGYFSGGELDSVRTRATLKKRESGSHSRKSSYTDEQRVRAGTAHSRYSSAGSIRELGFASIALPTASQMYHGKSMNDRLRATGKGNTFMPTRALKDPTSPTVTRLDNGAALTLGPDTDASSSGRVSPIPMSRATSTVGASKSKTHATSGLRAISDAVTGTEKAQLYSPTLKPSTITESPVRSPTETGSSTPSGSKSFDSDPCEGRKPTNDIGRARTSSGTTRRKSKKETSAYREGLEEKTPQDAIKDCDYSGWMRKKSSKLIAVWNQRLFVLRGTRLAYYYSENDRREKGVIDIAFHRVLSAENDRITGLHATLTGATASPTSPQGAMTPTSASTDAVAEPELASRKFSNDSVFIFKLVPPRAGLSKAVTFTMPKVHYFAVDNINQGRLWMAALMKATIDRDETSPITSTYQLKTISLTKARAMKQRPPALMGPDETVDEEPSILSKGDEGLNIRGIIFSGDADEGDSEMGKTRDSVKEVSSFDEGKLNLNT
ncbi:MAG: polar growth protein [Trichoglossum hirsutum]|nr:MAG: polar growth protein [Trichoglossum hirsutum]